MMHFFETSNHDCPTVDFGSWRLAFSFRRHWGRSGGSTLSVRRLLLLPKVMGRAFTKLAMPRGRSIGEDERMGI